MQHSVSHYAAVNRNKLPTLTNVYKMHDDARQRTTPHGNSTQLVYHVGGARMALSAYTRLYQRLSHYRKLGFNANTVSLLYSATRMKSQATSAITVSKALRFISLIFTVTSPAVRM